MQNKVIKIKNGGNSTAKKGKQGVFEEVGDPNGKLIDTQAVVIAVPQTIREIEVRKLDNGYIRLIKDDITADGATMEEAFKNFKRNYRNATV